MTLNYAVNASGAPATNRIQSDSQGFNYSYDEVGNMTVGLGQSYTYDGANRLKTASNGNSSFGYDGDGKRVKKIENGSSIYYVYSAVLGQTVMEVNSSAVQTSYVYHDGRVVAQLNPDGQFYWRHINHLGGTRAMTDTNGNLVYKAFHDPYGQILSEWSASGNNNLSRKKFTDYDRDTATGLDYAGARMYNSVRGRFLQSDPAGQASARKGSPLSLNRYAYSGNNPINNTDSSGLNYDPFLIRFFGESACRSQGVYFLGLTFLSTGHVTFLCSGGLEVFRKITKDLLEEAGDYQRSQRKIGRRAPLTGQKKTDYNNEKARALEAVKSEGCTKFLDDALNGKGKGTKDVIDAINNQRAYDVTGSTITQGDAGIVPPGHPDADKPVSDLGADEGRAFTAIYANSELGKEARSTLNDVFYNKIYGITILHEALHSVTGLDDPGLAGILGATFGPQDINGRLRQMDCNP